MMIACSAHYLMQTDIAQKTNELFLFHSWNTHRNTGRTMTEEGFEERVTNLGGLYGAGSRLTLLTAHANQISTQEVIRANFLNM